MQRIEVNVLGGLPTTYDSNRYVLVACDTYTKYMQAWPMMSQTAQETAHILYDNWLTVHGALTGYIPIKRKILKVFCLN